MLLLLSLLLDINLGFECSIVDFSRYFRVQGFCELLNTLLSAFLDIVCEAEGRRLPHSVLSLERLHLRLVNALLAQQVDLQDVRFRCGNGLNADQLLSMRAGIGVRDFVLDRLRRPLYLVLEEANPLNLRIVKHLER